MVGSEATTLLAAKLDGRIVGFLALAMFPIPTGFRAWIEDVIVDEAARGQGIGEALTRKALDLAEARRRPDRGPDLAPLARGRWPALRAGRFRRHAAPASYRYTFGQTA